MVTYPVHGEATPQNAGAPYYSILTSSQMVPGCIGIFKQEVHFERALKNWNGECTGN